MTVTKHARRIEAEVDDATVRFEDEAAFGRYVVLFWRWSPLIVGVAVACGAITALLALGRPTEYQATSTLAVSGSKIADQATLVISVNYRPFIENNSVAEAVVKEFHLGDAPDYITPQVFLESVLSVEEVRNSNLIRLHVTLRDPARAAKLANRVSDLAAEGARKLSQAEAVQARDDLRSEVDDSRTRMEKAAAALEGFKTTAQLELTREDVKAMLEQRGRLLDLVVGIEGLRGKVARAEADLAARQRVDSLIKTIDSEPALAQAARAAGGSDSSLLGLQIKSQEPNQVYQSIDEQLAKDRAELAGLERRRAELIGSRGLDRQQQAMLTALYKKESALTRLTTEYEVAGKSYQELAARYDVARVQVAGRSGQIQVIDRAMEPNVPQSRHVTRNAVFGFVGGGTFAALGLALTVALRETLTRARAA
jgi:uncharacterized protein involved in exopolysaccharide biosynthesis